MTPEQWTTLVGQLGVGGAVVFVLAKMVFPMLLARIDAVVTAVKETTSAVDKNTAAIGSLTERVARLEGIFDHSERTPVEYPAPVGRGARKT